MFEKQIKEFSDKKKEYEESIKNIKTSYPDEFVEALIEQFDNGKSLIKTKDIEEKL